MFKGATWAVFFLACNGLGAATKKIELTALEVYENVLKAQKKQVAFSCDIVREEIKAGSLAQKVTGTLKTMSGGRAWLEITAPSRQLAVSDGKSLYVELSDVKQVMKYDAAQLKKSGNFFLDLGSSIQYYAKASLKRLIVPGQGFDAAKVSALELMPLDPSTAGFDRMRVWVEKNGWLVRQVELKLEGMDIRVKFENIKVLTKAEVSAGAKAPDKAIFNYKPPQGYEVFDMASMQ